MSCCPDRVGMRKNESWKYYKTVKSVCVNSGYITHCITQDPEVLRITSAVTEKTGKIAWVECANVKNLSAQVVRCDLKVYVKVAEKPSNAVRVRASCRRARTEFSDYRITFVDEDGDESAEYFEKRTQKMIDEIIEYNKNKFGLVAIKVERGKHIHE